MEKYENIVNRIVNQTKKRVEKERKPLTVNIYYRSLKAFGRELTEREQTELDLYIKNHMTEKISESKQSNSVHICRTKDGRYSFYLTKTPTRRSTSGQSNKENQPIGDFVNIISEGVYLDFDQETFEQAKKRQSVLNIDVDLNQLRKENPKMETIHFRVEADIKQKLNLLCERENIKASDLLRQLLQRVL